MSAFTITVANALGLPIDPSFQLMSVDIIHEVNKMPYAELSYVDGSASAQEFRISNSEAFLPGAEIQIKARLEADLIPIDQVLFSGIVVKHSIEASADSFALRVELSDKAIKMTKERKSAVYRFLNDTAIIQQLFTAAEILPGQVAPTLAFHPELVQYYCTDWDFALSRAEANGLWIYLEQGQVNLVDPALLANLPPLHQFSFGEDILMNIHLEIDSAGQIETAESTGWDLKSLAMSPPVAGADFQPTVGDQIPSDLAAAAGAGSFLLQSGVPLSPEEQQAWADAQVK